MHIHLLDGEIRVKKFGISTKKMNLLNQKKILKSYFFGQVMKYSFTNLINSILFYSSTRKGILATEL